MKKGYTLAEVLITLVLLGVVMAITIPVLNSTKPNKDETTYKKALYNVQAAMIEAMQRPEAYASEKGWADPDIDSSSFCEALGDALNTTGTINCSGGSSYDNPNFTTSDGIKFWGLDGNNFTATGYKEVTAKTIYVDRELSAQEKKALIKKRDASHGNPGMKIQITDQGKVQTGKDANWDYENKIIKKFVTPSHEKELKIEDK